MAKKNTSDTWPTLLTDDELVMLLNACRLQQTLAQLQLDPKNPLRLVTERLQLEVDHRAETR